MKRDPQEAASAVAKLLLAIGKLELHVGVVGPNALSPADREGDPEMTLARLAALHEFGSDVSPGEPGHIPERSFMRSTATARRLDLAKLQKRVLKQVLDGKLSVEKALDVIGAQYATWIKQTVLLGAGVPPPNAESTIQKKGSSRPLVDKGTLINHGVTWVVRPAGDR